MSQEGNNREMLKACGFTYDQIDEAYQRYDNWDQAANFLLEYENTINTHEEERKNNPHKPIIRIGAPELPQKRRIINEEHIRKLEIHLQGKNYILLAVNSAKNFQFNEMYFDQLIQLDRHEFPGIAEIERRNSHSEFLVCRLKKDDTDEYSKKIFRTFKNLLTKTAEGMVDRRIIISNRYCYERKSVFLICHKGEHTGFGEAVRKTGCDFCLFEIPCSLWYNVIDPLEQRVKELEEIDKLRTRNYMIMLNKLQRNKEKIRELKNKIMYEQF